MLTTNCVRFQILFSYCGPPICGETTNPETIPITQTPVWVIRCQYRFSLSSMSVVGKAKPGHLRERQGLFQLLLVHRRILLVSFLLWPLSHPSPGPTLDTCS